MSNVNIDGIEYAPIRDHGIRAVVVVDKGWIFAGDLFEQNGKIILTRAVWVFKWEAIGFDGVLKTPGSGRCQIRKLSNDVVIPCGAEVFRIPVSDDWGL